MANNNKDIKIYWLVQVKRPNNHNSNNDNNSNNNNIIQKSQIKIKKIKLNCIYLLIGQAIYRRLRQRCPFAVAEESLSS